MTEVDAISKRSFMSGSEQVDTCERIRDLPSPPGATVLVTGGTADFVDFQSSLEATCRSRSRSWSSRRW